MGIETQAKPPSENFIPPGYEYLANYILDQEEIVLFNAKGDSDLVYPFNILLLRSMDKYLEISVWHAGAVIPYTIRDVIPHFIQQLPPGLFYHQGRFYTINTVRFKGVCNNRNTFKFDASCQVKVPHHIPPGIEEIMKTQKRLFFVSRR